MRVKTGQGPVGGSVEMTTGRSTRPWMEMALVLVVFAVGFGLGMAVLVTHRGQTGQSSINCPPIFLARSAMIAAGRGSFLPELGALPELNSFLEGKAAVFDPASLPANIVPSSDSAAEYHVYLGWTVGILWRIFGISWRVLEPFLALGLGLCTVCVYGLFRLAMNRWISVAGAALFVTSPAVLGQVNDMRDFLKAPFMLAGMFAAGWLVTRKKPERFLWAGMVCMGLVAGAGMGFRQDTIILVPISLGAILVLSPGVAYRTPSRRVAAAVLYLLAFVAAAAPMLGRMEGGAQPYHPLAQGYSFQHMNRCALQSAACAPLVSSHDFFVFSTIFSYARRQTGDNELYFGYSAPEDARFTRDWVFRTAMQFPADTVARTYGAILNLLGDSDDYGTTLSRLDGFLEKLAVAHRGISGFFRVLGPAIALLALLAAAAAGFRYGVVLLLLTLYFCGYISLDYEFRHSFHISFVSCWAAGFLVQQTIWPSNRLAAARRGGACGWDGPQYSSFCSRWPCGCHGRPRGFGSSMR